MLLGATSLMAQGQTYSLNFSKSDRRMQWRHSLPSWSYAVPVRADSSSLLRLSTSVSRSDILDRRDTGDIWQEDSRVSFSANYPVLGPKAAIGIGGNASQRRSTLRRQGIQRHSLNFNFRYSPLQEGPFRNLRVTVVPGLITAGRAGTDAQGGAVEERGLQYSAALAVTPDFEIGGEKLNPSFSLSKRDNTLKTNKNRNESLSMGLLYTLPGDIRTSMRYAETRSQQSLSQSLSGNPGGDLRFDRSRNLASSVDFSLGEWKVNGKVDLRRQEGKSTVNALPDNRLFGSDRLNQRWSAQFGASGKLDERLDGSMRFSYAGQVEEKLPVVRQDGVLLRAGFADRTDRDLSVSGSFNWQMAEGHRLRLSGRIQMERDGDPGQRREDRDFYSANYSINYQVGSDSGLRTTVKLSTRYTHKVNLRAIRAADNARGRDLNLSASTSYQRLGASISHAFGVGARSTIYDFDRRLSAFESDRRSTIRRNWSMRHSLQCRLVEGLRINMSYTHRAEDAGKLISEEGVQLLDEAGANRSISFGMRYSGGEAFSLATSYRHTLNRDWQYDFSREGNPRQLFRRTHRTLRVEVGYSPAGNNSVSLNGSRSRQRSGTFDNFQMKYNRKF